MPKGQSERAKRRLHELFVRHRPVVTSAEWTAITNDRFIDTWQPECADLETDDRLIARLNGRIQKNMGIVDVGIDEQMRGTFASE